MGPGLSGGGEGDDGIEMANSTGPKVAGSSSTNAARRRRVFIRAAAAVSISSPKGPAPTLGLCVALS